MRNKMLKRHGLRPTGYAASRSKASGVTRMLRSVLCAVLLLVTSLPMTTFAQQSNVPVGRLTEAQLRRTVIDLSDELVAANERLPAADRDPGQVMHLADEVQLDRTRPEDP